MSSPMNRFSNLLMILAVLFLAADVFAQDDQPVNESRTIAGGVLNGKAISLPKPEYPESARKAGVTGTLRVQILVDETGNVVSAKTLSGPEDSELRASAESAAMRSKFSPTTLEGQPAKVQGVIEYNFVIVYGDPEHGYVEKVKPLGMAMFLECARAFADHPEKLKESLDGEDLLKDIAEEMPLFSKELEPLLDFDSLSPQKRVEVINNAIAGIKAKASPSDRWQIELGQRFGNIIGPIMLIVALEGNPEAIASMDGGSVKKDLLFINELLTAAPNDFPQEILDKFKIFAAMGEIENPISEENIDEFMQKVLEIVETIAPDSE